MLDDGRLDVDFRKVFSHGREADPFNINLGEEATSLDFGNRHFDLGRAEAGHGRLVACEPDILVIELIEIEPVHHDPGVIWRNGVARDNRQRRDVGEATFRRRTSTQLLLHFDRHGELLILNSRVEQRIGRRVQEHIIAAFEQSLARKYSIRDIDVHGFKLLHTGANAPEDEDIFIADEDPIALDVVALDLHVLMVARCD